MDCCKILCKNFKNFKKDRKARQIARTDKTVGLKDTGF